MDPVTMEGKDGKPMDFGRLLAQVWNGGVEWVCGCLHIYESRVLGPQLLTPPLPLGLIRSAPPPRGSQSPRVGPQRRPSLTSSGR